jgi:LAO/AO transport system kinase
MSKTVQTIEERAAGILAGDRLAITRAITLVENEREGWKDLLSKIYHATGRGYRIGLTGPPGAGKSTLTQKLITHYRLSGHRVAVIAIDPTSPYTGGAILGDRVRMQSETLHPEVFIRSMATRGSLGGLNAKAQDVADILDASGFDIIIYETVGVGQSELDIARAADTTAVVLVPESGDSIQAMKSGLMEIADLFALNKSDREGADQAVAALKTILTFRITHAAGEWIPDVIKTVGTTGDGIEPLVAGIAAHREYLTSGGRLEIRRGARERLRVTELVENQIRHSFWTPERRALLEKELPELVARRQSPLQLAEHLVREV